ncbi:MAG: hypothetical protein WD600_03220, partial [Pseudohongiella sp.]
MESSIDMAIDWDLDRVFRHFTDQIAQQDWQNDNDAVGNFSATASWVRNVDESQLFGSLRVIQTADTQYRLQFSIQSMSED